MSKLKTVWDAVNEFKGVWPYTCDGMIESKGDLTNLNKGDLTDFSIRNSKRLNLELFSFTCNKGEFNTLVEEMTLGLDVNGVTHGELFDYVNADKALLEKETKPDYTSLEFWKDAPEGYDYAVIRNKATDNVSFYKDAPTYQCIFKHGNHHYMLCFKKGDVKYNAKYYHVVKRPQSIQTETPEEKEALDSIVNKPLIYTQEMADNDELPSVGMQCMYRDSCTGNYILVEVMYISEWAIVIKQVGDGYGKDVEIAKYIDNANLKPIDQRTKKEKAIDELRNLDDSICNDIEWHANFLQAIIDGKITGVKWVGE